MDVFQHYDPELAAALQVFPGSASLDLIDWNDLPGTREKVQHGLELLLAPLTVNLQMK